MTLMPVGKILVKVRTKPGPAHSGELGLDPSSVLSLGNVGCDIQRL